MEKLHTLTISLILISVSFAGCFGDSESEISGKEIVNCLDENASNFNPESTSNDDCEFGLKVGTDVYGCTSSQANNYDSNATVSDGSCDYDLDDDGILDWEEIPGCNDIYANNYDNNSTDNDGSCDYDLDDDGILDYNEVLGCTNSTAPNFNQNATDDDGSCIIDSDGDGIYDSQDLCPGYDDGIDADNDSKPDGCEDLIDSDGDGVEDSSDMCPGHDDNIDIDNDSKPDDCDGLIDVDQDGVADYLDICEGYDDNQDTDLDSVPDGCDAFPFDENESMDSDDDGIGDNADYFPYDVNRWHHPLVDSWYLSHENSTLTFYSNGSFSWYSHYTSEIIYGNWSLHNDSIWSGSVISDNLQKDATLVNFHISGNMLVLQEDGLTNVDGSQKWCRPLVRAPYTDSIEMMQSEVDAATPPDFCKLKPVEESSGDDDE